MCSESSEWERPALSGCTKRWLQSPQTKEEKREEVDRLRKREMGIAGCGCAVEGQQMFLFPLTKPYFKTLSVKEFLFLVTK